MTSFLQTFYALLLLAFLAAAFPGVPKALEEVDPGDPEAQACASFALESFNYYTREPHLYVITKIHTVKKANIGGGQYEIDLEVKKSECKKEDQGDKDSCQNIISADAKTFQCRFVVLSAPWKKQRILIRSSCTP